MPFDGPPPTINDLTIELSYYRHIRTTDPKKAKDLMEAVMGRITDLKDGKEALFTGSGTVIEISNAGDEVWSNEMDYEPAHSMLDADHELTRIDPDELDDLEDERS
ncbi:MAG: hypothetical protein JRC86_12820 [Deltaproteobacteria bacterium]|nr:hypothetical protein [Deltaproteobacteria bacterium]